MLKLDATFYEKALKSWTKYAYHTPYLNFKGKIIRGGGLPIHIKTKIAQSG